MPALHLNNWNGGRNGKVSPLKLMLNQLSECINWIPTDNGLEKRLGYDEINSTAISTNPNVISLFDFLPSTEEYRLYAQASDGLIYYLSAGSVFVSAYSGNSAANPACYCQYRDTFFITNGKNYPQVGTIDEALPVSVLKTLDEAVSFIDYTDEAIDDDLSTHIALDALDTWANGDSLYICFPRQLSGIKAYIDATNKNANTSVLSVEYYNGSWGAVSGFDDGTDTGGATLNVTGWITWTLTTDSVFQTINGITGHWYRFKVSAALSATVDVEELRCRAPIQKIGNLWDGQYQPVHDAWSNIGGTYKNILADLVDGVTTDGYSVGGLSAANLWLGVGDRARGFRFKLLESPNREVNAVSAAMLMSCWNGTAYAGVTIVDGTKDGTATLGKDGEITFAWPTAAEKRHVGSTMGAPLYWFVFKPAAAITNPTTLVEVDYLPETYIPDSWKFRFCSIFKQRLFLARTALEPNFIYFSGARMPETFDGLDAGYLEIGPGHPIQFLMSFYHYLVIGVKHHGVYILEGYNSDTFGLMKIATIDCIAPDSAATVDLRDKGGGEYGFFLARDGIYRVEGVSCVKVSPGLDDLFDVNSALYIDFNNVEAKASGAIYKHREWYVCAVPLRTSAAAQTTNNYWLVHNYRTGACFLFNIAADCVGTYLDSIKQERLIHGGHGDGDVYLDDDDANNTDNGTAITARFDTGQLMLDKEGFGFDRAIAIDLQVRHKLGGGALSLSAFPDHKDAAVDLGDLCVSGSGAASRWRGIDFSIEAMSVALRGSHASSAAPPIIYDMRLERVIEEDQGDRR